MPCCAAPVRSGPPAEHRHAPDPPHLHLLSPCPSAVRALLQKEGKGPEQARQQPEAKGGDGQRRGW